MDKIWYRNPSKSEVIGRCGGDEKPNDHAEPRKSRTIKIQKTAHTVKDIGSGSFLSATSRTPVAFWWHFKS